MSRVTGRAALAYAIVVLSLWPWPVLRILHVESSAVVAFAAFFIAGLSEWRSLDRPRHARRALARQVGLLAVPLALLTLSMLWAPNCAYLTGLVYFLLFTIPSAVLGVSVAALVRQLRVRSPRFLFVALGAGLAIAGVVFDLGFHPQFYTFNHVFGGIMGPIYDEDFAFRWGLLPFRVLTLGYAWICLSVAVLLRLRRSPARYRFSGPRRRVHIGTAVTAGLVVVVYLLRAPLGINTPEAFIRAKLGGFLETDRAVIHYRPDDPNVQDIESIAAAIDFHTELLITLLDLPNPEPVHVYLYPDPFLRERLTGARFTNVAPVWLRSPQVHVLSSESRRVLTHELGHVMMRPFGLPPINASPSVGLVEGMAVALEAPSGAPSTHDQVAAAMFGRSRGDRESRVDAVVSRLSPLGFWGGRGAVSYASAGSFLAYLIEQYGAARVAEAYRSGRLDGATGEPIETLAEEWEAYLRARTFISAAAGPTSRRRFSVPSLFEQRCPHYTPPPRRHFIRSLRSLYAADTTASIAAAERAWSLDTTFVAALALASRLHAERGDDLRALRLIGGSGRELLGPAELLREGDARWRQGDEAGADSSYRQAWMTSSAMPRSLTAGIALRRRLLSDPAALGVLLGTTEASSVSPSRPADSIAVAIRLFRDGDYRGARRLAPAVSPEPSLNEEEGMLALLALSVAEAASAALMEMRSAEVLAELQTKLHRDAGDVDAARVSRYRQAFYRWRAEKPTVKHREAQLN